MLRFAAFAVLFAVVCAVPINDDSKSGDHDVIVIDNINDHLAENPGAKLIGELEKEDIQDRNHIKTYAFGKRVSGDRIVASNDQFYHRLTPGWVSAGTQYPTNGGIGSIVSRVEMRTNQTSDIVRFYVLSGDVGQREIYVGAETIDALYFHFSTRIYGYDAPT